MKIKNKPTQAGFSLFIAVIVTGALLVAAVTVANLGAKETEFSSLNKESQYAIFAADAGIECALYWDTRPAGSAFDPLVSGSPINCGEHTMANNSVIEGTSVRTLIGGGGGNSTSTFGFVLNQGVNPVPACAIVTVAKYSSGLTHIFSRGYNNCNIDDARRVERGLEVRY